MEKKRAPEFLAGAATADVTPKNGVSMDDAISKPGPAKGVHDPLTARAIVVKSGGTTVALAIVAMCMIEKSVYDQAKEIVQEKVGIEPVRVLAAATHSHATPRAIHIGRGPLDDAYHVWLSKQIAAAIIKAHGNLAPATVAHGSFEQPSFIKCRRFLCQPGTVGANPFGETGERIKSVAGPGGKVPSRVNLMTGKSNVFNYVDFGVFPKGEPTFANHFKAQGYATAVAGKWQLLTTQNGISPAEAGFDRHCVWNIPGTERRRYWEPSLMHDGKVINHGEEKYGSTVIADYLFDFIKTNKDKPFLAYYPMDLPHNPFDPTPRSKNRKSKNGKQNFIDMVAYMDHCVGRIEDTLTELGLRENTLMIFTADNGTNSSLTLDFFGTQRKGGKGYTHDHGTKVPLIVNLPGRIKAGQVNKDLICFSDLFPTIVEAADLPAKKITQGDGWSFWPQCLGKEGKKREWIYGYYFPRPYSQKFDVMYNHWEVAWARNKRYKLYRDGRFFDVINDVREEKPLGDRTELNIVRKSLQAALNDYPKKGGKIDYERVTGVRKAPEAKKKKPKRK